MLKRILLFAILVSALIVSNAQTGYYPNDLYSRWRGVKVDSSFHAPTGETPRLSTRAYQGAGALFYSTADSAGYDWSGHSWYRRVYARDSVDWLATKTFVASSGRLFGRTDERNETEAGVYFSNADNVFEIDSVATYSVTSYTDFGIGRIGIEYPSIVRLSSESDDEVHEMFTATSEVGLGSTIDVTGSNKRIDFRLRGGDSARLYYTGYAAPHVYDTVNFKIQVRNIHSGAFADTYWPVSAGGGSTNLATSDLTQAAESRTYDQNGQDLSFEGGGRFWVRNTAGTSRYLEIDQSAGAGFIGYNGATGFGFTSTESQILGLNIVNDSSTYKHVVIDGSGNLRKANWLYAGGGGGTSITFGAAGQVPITNSNTHNFSYLNTFWIDSTNGRFTFGTSSSSTSPFHIYLGSDVNSPNPAGLRLSTATRAMNIGLGASNHGYFLQTGGDNAAGFVFLTRQSYPLVSMYRDQTNIYTNNIERAEWGLTELVLNDLGNDYDFRIETDTDTHALFVDGGNNGVVIGSSTLTSGSKLTVNGQMDVPGTEASTYKWNEAASEAPASTTYAAPTNYIGINTTNALFTPYKWLRVQVAGEFLLVPAYQPFIP